MSALSLILLSLAAGSVVPPAQGPSVESVIRDLRSGGVRELPGQLRAWVGEKGMREGASRQEGLQVVWTIEAPGAKEVTVADELSPYRLKLNKLRGSEVFAAWADLPAGTAMRWRFLVDEKPLGQPRQLEAYPVNPENVPQAGVPKGTLVQQPAWKSKIFDGTTRDWWIYVPAQYRPESPAAVMVFQDGQWAKNYVPNTFDNLIAKGDMPVTVGVFLAPGTFADSRSNRSFEYDTLSDQYARFLLEEILPEVEKTAHLRTDPESRAIAGTSSGGICAFTVAWQRPDQFSKVMSWVGSFVNLGRGKTGIEGGHNYPPMIRMTPKKPIRVYLQDGENDLDNPFGNWPLANRQMDKALSFAGYDHMFVLGNGFHSDAHGRSELPNALRWLWRK
jgi:enterochelin esterase family protein